MTNSEKRSSRDVLHSFEESIFKPRLEDRVALPSDEGLIFEEVQAMDQIWVWALMGFELVLLLGVLFVVASPVWTIAVFLLIMTMTMALLGSIKLYTRIDREGVHFRMTPFHFREQTIYWEDIDQIHVRQYEPIKEYGGWGIKVGLKGGKAYNIKGNFGIQIRKKDGKSLLLGTQLPEEAARHLSEHPLLV